MLSHDGGSRFVHKGARLHRHMPPRLGSANLIQRNVISSRANLVGGLIQGTVTLGDQLHSPLDDLSISSLTSNQATERACPRESEREIDHEILDVAKPNQLPKSVDSSMVSSLTSLDPGEETTLAGVTMSSHIDLQCRETDLTLGMRANCCIRNIDQQTVPEIGLESSGEVDSGRTIIYPSHGCTLLEKLISKSLSNSIRNTSRTCSHCGTLKTPLWRSGPMGPKSLCNACGIRLQKAGRRNAKIELQEAPSICASSLKGSAKALKYAGTHRNDWHVVKKTKLSVSKKEAAEDEESSESRDYSAEVLQRRKIRHKAQSDAAAHAFSNVKPPFARFSEIPKPRRDLDIPHVPLRDEEEAATLLMALSYDCLAS